MNVFKKHDINSGSWYEWEIQAYIIQEARRIGLFIEGDQNAGKRSYAAAARAKACGMLAGTPDMRVLTHGGIVIFIELKKKNGELSPAQEEWQQKAKDTHHHVYTIYADTPGEAWSQFKSYVKDYASYICNLQS